MLKNPYITSKLLPKSERIYLCFPSSNDKEEFLLATRNSIKMHHPWVQAPCDETQYYQYIQKLNLESHIGFFIRKVSDQQLVGVINISEIVKGVFESGYLGFYLFKNFSKQGFMYEGLSLALHFYFKVLKLHRLEANIQPKNFKSLNLVRKLNFRREGFSPKYLKINGKWCDHERYAILSEEYNKQANRY